MQLSGKAAAMGQGVIQDVSATLTQTFADNLAEMLSAPESAEPAEATPAATTRTQAGGACRAEPAGRGDRGERRQGAAA